ncbi:MAG: hypothetical protein ACREIV_02015 [Planctomycetaceae bacterium]
MDRFSREDLRALISHQKQHPCVSLYMPAHRTGRDVRENSIRCKNLVGKVEKQLEKAGIKGSDARGVLDPLRQLQDDEFFWQHQSDGLAAFSAPGFFRRYRLPLNLEELSLAGRRFHVKPALPLLQNDGRFYLLAVSMNEVRLLRGTRHSVSELETDALPKSLIDALNIDEYVQSLQQHAHTTMGAGAAGASEGMFHGQGGSDLDIKKKDEIRQYFLRINDGLKEYFGEERAPLVFAGVEYQFPIFRDACSYRSLVEKPIVGNPELLSAEQLHAKAWSLVEPIFRKAQDAWIARYHDRKAHALASHELGEILAAAWQGRVETLMVARGENVWGQAGEQGGITRRTDTAEFDTEDLLDHAAVRTLLSGGTVYALERAEMPDGVQIAAVYRYAAS